MQHTTMWLPKASSPTSRPKHTGTVIRTCLNKMMYFGMSLKIKRHPLKKQAVHWATEYSLFTTQNSLANVQ